MSYTFSPSGDYRSAFKKGMSGSDVAVLQLNLGVAVDGSFGPQTDAAVRKVQTAGGLKVDGIAGVITQRHVALACFSKGAASYKLPTGLLQSVASNESAFALACFSEHPSDVGFDIGVLQHSIPPEKIGSQKEYALGYDAKAMSAATAAKIRAQKDKFYGRKGAQTHKRAWQLAILFHNWQTAADNMSKGYGPYLTKDNDAPQDWIIEASGGRLRTPNQWVESYVEKCSVYVSSWNA